MGELIEVARIGEIALFNCDGEYYAIDNDCTHVGGPLCEGELDGYTVTCPWHGAEFNVRTGEVLAPPAEENVDSYKVHVESYVIKIEI